MGPGPSDVAPSVLAALSAPTVGHLDPYFLPRHGRDAADAAAGLPHDQRVDAGRQRNGSRGHGGVRRQPDEPGDRMLVCVNGVFGGRMADVAARAGAKVTKLERNFGEVFQPTRLPRRSSGTRPKSWASCMRRPRPAPGNHWKKLPKSSTMPAGCCWWTA